MYCKKSIFGRSSSVQYRIEFSRKSSLLSSLNQLEPLKNHNEPIRMSNMQVSIPQSGAVSSANKEEESESVEETTLTEVNIIMLPNQVDWLELIVMICKSDRVLSVH